MFSYSYSLVDVTGSEPLSAFESGLNCRKSSFKCILMMDFQTRVEQGQVVIQVSFYFAINKASLTFSFRQSRISCF